MDIELVKKLIKEEVNKNDVFINKALEGYRYYLGDTDILYRKVEKDENNNPLKNADNRINGSWFGLLVDQKAAYLSTYPPVFDTGDKSINKKIVDVLGDKFPKVCKDLTIEAATKARGWLHYWKNEKNEFKYAVVPAEEIRPLFSKDLEKELIGVLRCYTSIDNEDGQKYDIYEYWTKEECSAYRKLSNSTFDALEEYNLFGITYVDEGLCEQVNSYKHGFDEVPFINFDNNNVGTNDLKKVKLFIDVYEKVFSGFVNDLDDLQEVIFVLTNYGGTNLSTFIEDLKKHKVVDMQTDGADEKSGLDTITVDIPVEARNKILEICEKQIYKQGQGVDPDPEKFGNTSGVALSFLYSLLELKSGLTETEFRLGYAKLIRALLKHIGLSSGSITQTWTRNMIRNDTELVDMLSKSKGLISDEDIIRNHPLIDDVDKALERFKKQQEDNTPFQDKVPIEDDIKPVGGNNE